MQALVIGAEGQLGVALCEALRDAQVVKADLDGGGIHLDITNFGAVRTLLCDLRPDIVVNTAAVHDTAYCETHPKQAFDVNAIGTLWVAKACAEAGARLVHISTDYVFGGRPPTPQRPYVETDIPAPLNVYASSKLAGEYLAAAYCANHVIVRTAALYGLAPCRGKGGRNFVETMLRLADTGEEVKVVADEITTPTYTVALARQLRVLAERADPGLYHATCAGACSWYEFAQAIFEESGVEATLVATTSEEFQSHVPRPAYSVLDNQRIREARLDVMPPWRAALKEYAAARR